MKLVLAIGFDVLRAPWATRPLKIAEGLIQQGHILEMWGQESHQGEPIIHTLPSGLDYETIPWTSKVGKFKKLFLESEWNKKLLEIKPDAFHIQKPTLGLWSLARFAKENRIPLLYDWDDWEGSGGIRTGWKGIKTDTIERWYARNADWIIFSNKEIQKRVEELYGRHSSWSLGPCGADLQLFNKENYPPQSTTELKDKFGIKPEDQIIVYHGQWEMGSDFEVLSAVVNELSHDPKIKFLLIGSGNRFEEFCSKFPDELKKEKFITPGKVPFLEIPKYLSLAHLAIAPFPDNLYTRCKSPLKIYEYLAMGIPIVSAGVGQIVDIISPDVGILVPPGDGEKMIHFVKEILYCPSLQEKLAKNSRLKAEKTYSWEKAADTFKEAYWKLLG